ncbi:MAG: 3-phosphoshikimate 1-carboxyvinyltransferase [uncultured Thermomicrobiales bacterium]|uniref:3-phosphoshikimate 1-carboxyvinyltransferase n=1 Tax=uncultured Thermomicrobiales bacterium TaxID=1645740 RepID=A0A6J4U8K8_9BACT|nr:MAG: 3-phosphoshikimate 1-carboxyvinyltransferase [uncultured Thermomicrobiales bacterium]
MYIANASFRQDIIAMQPISRAISGTAAVPGSKSITNRALLIAALAEGPSTLTGALFSDDTRYMAGALNQLGITVRGDEDAERFDVEGGDGTFPASSGMLFVGNSGTTARFLTAALTLGTGEFHLDGVPRMRERPIAPLIDALNQLGADVVSAEGNGCPPIVIRARGLRGGTARLAGDTSSQFFTGLLIAAPYAQTGVRIEVEGELVSKPYITITADVMTAFGVTPEIDDAAWRSFAVAPGQRYRGRHYVVEPDASNASYFFAAAAVSGGEIAVDGLGSRSHQGDLQFVRVLETMGCEVTMSETSTSVRGPADGRLRGGEFDFNAISDTAQTLAAIAPFADGPVTIRGIAHNRVKETDRIGAVATELRKLGQVVTEFDDGMTIDPRPVTPAEIETYDDHRMAMSFAITGLRASGVSILDPACVAKTFPSFFERLADLTHGR